MANVRRAVLALNLVGAVGSSASVVAMAIVPEAFLPLGVPGAEAARFFAKYAIARSLPLGAALVAAIWRGSERSIAGALGVLGAVQLGDALIGVEYANPGQILAPLALGALHLGSALWLERAGDRPAAAVPEANDAQHAVTTASARAGGGPSGPVRTGTGR